MIMQYFLITFVKRWIRGFIFFLMSKQFSKKIPCALPVPPKTSPTCLFGNNWLKVDVSSDGFHISKVCWPLTVLHIPFEVRLGKKLHCFPSCEVFVLSRSSFKAQSTIILSNILFLLTKVWSLVCSNRVSAVFLQTFKVTSDSWREDPKDKKNSVVCMSSGDLLIWWNFVVQKFVIV